MSGVVIAVLVVGAVLVYGVAWAVLAVAWVGAMDPRDISYESNRFAACGFASLWPLLWPAVVAFVVLRRRRDADRVEARVEQRLQDIEARRSRRINELEGELGIGGRS